MKIKKKRLITEGIVYDIKFIVNRVDMTFEAAGVRSYSPLLGRSLCENGIIRFQRTVENLVVLELLFAPFHMTDGSQSEILKYISDVRAISVNGFKIQARIEESTVETQILLEPKSIAEEGVEFEFSEAKRLWRSGEVTTVAAEEILSDIFVSEHIKISLTASTTPAVKTIASVDFDQIEALRTAVAGAFGRDFAAALAARHGFEVDE